MTSSVAKWTKFTLIWTEPDERHMSVSWQKRRTPHKSTLLRHLHLIYIQTIMQGNTRNGASDEMILPGSRAAATVTATHAWSGHCSKHADCKSTAIGKDLLLKKSENSVFKEYKNLKQCNLHVHTDARHYLIHFFFLKVK